MSNAHWYRSDEKTPPEGVILTTMNSNGEEQDLIYSDGLWWHTDMSSYVYHVPHRWKERCS